MSTLNPSYLNYIHPWFCLVVIFFIQLYNYSFHSKTVRAMVIFCFTESMHSLIMDIIIYQELLKLKLVFFCYRYRQNKSYSDLKIQKVYFFWICRDEKAFEWFTDLLRYLEIQVKKKLKSCLSYRWLYMFMKLRLFKTFGVRRSPLR